MLGIFGGKKRWLLIIIPMAFLMIAFHLLALSGTDIRKQIKKVPLPKIPGLTHDKADDMSDFELEYTPHDRHPISKLINEADKRWREYDENRSETFRDAVAKYRRTYGRHPPPLFDVWYKFARENNVYNVDDFEQIMGDLRPFWAIQPRILRTLAAHMAEKKEDGLSSIHVRNGKLAKTVNPGWRVEAFGTLVSKFAKHLPDIDLVMNRLDQPRVVVPWDDLQGYLSKEHETRRTPPEVLNEFTKENVTNLLNIDIDPEKDDSPREDAGWFNYGGKQYMDLARAACPPESHAVLNEDVTAAETTWKERSGGIVSNFNLSSDLCTIGPELQDKHGFLYSSSSTKASKKLVPVFGECKVNVNNDILFPANMYILDDARYKYDGSEDSAWEEKKDVVIWRGVSSGGTQVRESWHRMHRQRFVQLMNATVMEGKDVRILTEQVEAQGEFENFRGFQPAALLANISDVGFTELKHCIPDSCSFYDGVFRTVDPVELPDQFAYKFLVDVDGMSFSGRWRAFLQSRALGFKATIFREWHDSRLFAWRHFVPLDNRYDDLFSLLTYFLGVGSREGMTPTKPYVARHDAEGKRLALQGREWANKVLRQEDIEIYTFRLLIEYARLMDDNRDNIGYSGDGGEMDHYDSRGKWRRSQ